MQQFSFRLTFHRHDPRAGEGRIMTEHLFALDFTDAVRCARLMCGAMQSADPDRKYQIASVANDGVTGKVTVSGWMTEDEFSLHVAAQNRAAK